MRRAIPRLSHYFVGASGSQVLDLLAPGAGDDLLAHVAAGLAEYNYV